MLNGRDEDLTSAGTGQSGAGNAWRNDGTHKVQDPYGPVIMTSGLLVSAPDTDQVVPH